MFPGTFGRFVFVVVGAVDAGTFKGAREIENLQASTEEQARRYLDLCRRLGLEAQAKTEISYDVLGTIQKCVAESLRDHPDAVVFSGQLAFQSETSWTRWLHNYFAFALQRIYCRQGIPFVIVPVRVE
jgi:hypothetical protein